MISGDSGFVISDDSAYSGFVISGKLIARSFGRKGLLRLFTGTDSSTQEKKEDAISLSTCKMAADKLEI